MIRLRGGRSASRSAGRLTLARRRRAKQSCALCGLRSPSQPGSGCWHSSLTVFVTMTGMMHSASTGDSDLHPDFRDTLDLASPDSCESNSDPNPEAWRYEVAARLARYRIRRKPRAPRYPSLLLPFDSSSNWSRHTSSASFAATAEPVNEDLEHHFRLRPAVPVADNAPAEDEAKPGNPLLTQDSGQHLSFEEDGSFTNVIEFPRSAAIPVFHSTPLADPIVDRPRIVEAPEILPPPPALGGILIEPPQPELPERRPNTEPSIASASIPHRLLAVSLDVLILATAVFAFGAIFLRLNPIRLPLPGLAGPVAGLLVLLWMIYQSMFIVFTGSTPGLRVTRLRIAKLDGSRIARRTRRWRVLASFLSAFSAGLGYLWCFLDQDSLCWHDRITRTCIQSADSPTRS